MTQDEYNAILQCEKNLQKDIEYNVAKDIIDTFYKTMCRYIVKEKVGDTYVTKSKIYPNGIEALCTVVNAMAYKYGVKPEGVQNE